VMCLKYISRRKSSLVVVRISPRGWAGPFRLQAKDPA
jgi:hypothetical protein